MKHPIHALIALTVIVSLSAAAHAALNLSQTITGSSTLTPTGTPGDFIQNFSGTGDDAAFGAYDVTSMSNVDFAGPPNITITNGSITETFTNGTLFGTSFGTGLANGVGQAAVTLHFHVAGGTGFFSGDNGEATLTGTLTTTSPTTEDFTGTVTGSLTASTPLPASGLQATVLIGLLAVGATVKHVIA